MLHVGICMARTSSTCANRPTVEYSVSSASSSRLVGAYSLSDARDLHDPVARHHRDAWEYRGSRKTVAAD